MIPVSMKYLERCFNRAKELESRFVAVIINMEGYKSPEVIINPIENADDKVAYYKKVYDDNLVHKFSKEHIEIIGFSFGNSFADIYEDFFGD